MPAIFDTPITTNDMSIDRVLGAGLPVTLVFLDGTPAESFYETMERLAQENAGKMLLAKVHLKDNPNTARRYSISQPPAVVTLAQGQVKSKAERISGGALAKHTAFLLGKGPKPEAVPDATPPPAYRQSHAGQAQSGAQTGGRAYQQAGAPRGQAAQPITVTDATFEQEVLHSATPTLVDFWAPWCGPCRMTEPTLEKLAREMAGRLRIAKVNVDENPFLAQRYGIQSIPTMLIVRNGQVIDRWMGALPEPAMRSRVSSWM